MHKKIVYGIILLLCLTVSIESYFLLKGKETAEVSNTNEDKNNKIADEVKLINTKKENNIIIQEYEIVLNGEKIIKS